MKIKSFIIVVYLFAGLIISSLTAFMTFLIINEPIGFKMFSKIVFIIMLMLPIIGLISFYLGKYLSTKFSFIKNRLENIKEENFTYDDSVNVILEINEINESMNYLSSKLNDLIKNLKQKNANLSDLLISLAHDIKTPITVIYGYIEEIEDGLISDDDLPKALAHMKQELNFVNEITVDMLEYITSMKNHKERQKIDLKNFINFEVYPILEKQSAVKLINEVEKGFFIEFNTMDFKKVCLNILQNASSEL